MGSVLGYVPRFGLLTDEGRRQTGLWRLNLQKPEAAAGLCHRHEGYGGCAYIVGLDQWLKTLDEDAKTYLKDFGAATASNGAVGLYHVEGITPEAVQQGRDLIKEGAKTYVIDDGELERIYKSYPVIWKKKNVKPKLCFMGCPHMSLNQLITWTKRVEKGLEKQDRTRWSFPPYLPRLPL